MTNPETLSITLPTRYRKTQAMSYLALKEKGMCLVPWDSLHLQRLRAGNLSHQGWRDKAKLTGILDTAMGRKGEQATHCFSFISRAPPHVPPDLSLTAVARFRLPPSFSITRPF